jgi:hypothetical protein
MKFVVMAALCGLALAAAPALAAESVPAPAPAAAAPSAHALELARRYMTAMHMDRTMRGMFEGMLPALSDKLAASQGSQLTPEFRRAIGEVVTDWMIGEQLPKMAEAQVKILAEVYSEDELAAMANFYESPVGQAIVRKLPAAAARSGEIFKTVDLLTKQQLMERVCKKIDCVKAFAPKPDLPEDDHKKS